MPKQRSATLILALLASATVVASPRLSAQAAPPDALADLQRHFDMAAEKFVALARAMPAETYQWRPMDGVASVADVYTHIARYNYFYPETGLGVSAPMGAAEYNGWEGEVVEKERVVAILTESMEHVRRTLSGMSAADLEAPTRLYGAEVAKRAVLLQLITHMSEHLGQSIAYARSNGVVPPWSG